VKKKTRTVRLKPLYVDPHNALAQAFEHALARMMNRHDKYATTSLSAESRRLLEKEGLDALWLAFADEGIKW
jgi:hypothetical protein